MKLSSKTKKK